MKSGFRYLLSAMALGVVGTAVWALDLPVKRVNGADYYYYTVGQNESLMDVARKIGVTKENIISSNPSAVDGIKRGTVLYFPVYEYAENNLSLPGQSAGATGIDAPTRYKVNKGETLYGIARRFDVTPDEIVALNPEANAGVKNGQILLIPHHGAVDVKNESTQSPTVPSVIPVQSEPENASEDINKNEEEMQLPEFSSDERRLKPVNPDIVLISGPDDSDADDEMEESEDSVAMVSPTNISLMLPLMLDDKSQSRQARMSIDFVRGFMLGAKMMNASALPCDINVYDTMADSLRIVEILSDSVLHKADVIIAHEEGVAGKILPDYAFRNENYIFNLFAAHDTTYMINPYVVQTNIPAPMMYEKAAQAVMELYPDYVPVFLVSKGGKGEKVQFTTYLQEKYREKGIAPVELAYNGMLTSTELEDMDFSSKYVFIPGSGALSEFNKFIHALLAVRENIDDPSAIALFGYPDWTTFRGESLENLHRINATIYSRFYLDENSQEGKAFLDMFEQEYGTKPLEQVPSQAAMGYDSARYLLENTANCYGKFNPLEPTPFRGVQSTYMFIKADDEMTSGYVNTSVYIITFVDNNTVSVQVL